MLKTDIFKCMVVKFHKFLFPHPRQNIAGLVVAQMYGNNMMYLRVKKQGSKCKKKTSIPKSICCLNADVATFQLKLYDFPLVFS